VIHCRQFFYVTLCIHVEYEFLIFLNLGGQEIILQQITGTRTVVDISNYPAGVYIVRIVNDASDTRCKILKL
jgi:hypothetical protein